MCVATLVYVVGHMAGRINVDTVIELVGEEARLAGVRLTTKTPPSSSPPENWEGASPVADTRRGYLQQIDPEGLADWAVAHKTSIRLLVRPGDYVFLGASVALLRPWVDGAEGAIRNAIALGPTRVSSADLEFAMRQLVEAAVRALSPGINDPHTAISVLDRLGASLCDLAPLYLPTGLVLRDAQIVLSVPSVDYDGLVDTMFNMIRQNASRSPAGLDKAD